MVSIMMTNNFNTITNNNTDTDTDTDKQASVLLVNLVFSEYHNASHYHNICMDHTLY